MKKNKKIELSSLSPSVETLIAIEELNHDAYDPNEWVIATPKSRYKESFKNINFALHIFNQTMNKTAPIKYKEIIAV